MVTKENIRHRSSCFYLNQLKTEIKLRVLHNSLQHESGIQLHLRFYEGEPSDIDCIIEMKNHFLLLDLYKLIFNEGHAYQDVHLLLHEIAEELKLSDILKPWIEDPGLMMLRALKEYNQQVEQNLEII